MSDLLNPPSVNGDRYNPWVRAIAVTAAAAVMGERSDGRSYTPAPSAVATDTLTVAMRFETYIKTGRPI
jgi:hypothetical protein